MRRINIYIGIFIRFQFEIKNLFDFQARLFLDFGLKFFLEA